eukprot:1304412-Alexandrium_andersonii.AAC.1
MRNSSPVGGQPGRPSARAVSDGEVGRRSPPLQRDAQEAPADPAQGAACPERPQAASRTEAAA